MDQLARKHPKMVFQTIHGSDNHFLRTTLRERKADVAVTRRIQAVAEPDIVTEILFQDPMLVVTGSQNCWAARRKIDLSELSSEPWILPVPDSAIGMLVAESFHSSGLELPKPTVMTNSAPLRSHLLATGRYVSMVPRSMLQFGAQQLRVRILPVKLPGITQPVELLTLKNRMLSPAVGRFIERAREVARTTTDKPQSRKASQKN